MYPAWKPDNEDTFQLYGKMSRINGISGYQHGYIGTQTKWEELGGTDYSASNGTFAEKTGTKTVYPAKKAG